jgi:hypothetical protein
MVQIERGRFVDLELSLFNVVCAPFEFLPAVFVEEPM